MERLILSYPLDSIDGMGAIGRQQVEGRPAKALSRADLDRVLDEEDSACRYCCAAATVVDHIIPVSRGGTSDRANLAAACKLCNMDKLDWTPEEWQAERLADGRSWPPRWHNEFMAELESKGLLPSQFIAAHGPGAAERLHAAISRGMPSP